MNESKQWRRWEIKKKKRKIETDEQKGKIIRQQQQQYNVRYNMKLRLVEGEKKNLHKEIYVDYLIDVYLFVEANWMQRDFNEKIEKEID